MAELRPPFAFDDLDDLVRRARGGDAVASGALIERVREPLLARIRLLMGDEARRVAESSDFLHETFVAALPALDQVSLCGPTQFLNWLTAIARNRIRQGVRRRREQALSSLSQSLSGVPVAEPDSKAWFDELLHLAQAMEELPPDEQRSIELHDLQGLSFAVLGQRLGCSERHARRVHARAVLQLARAMRDDRPPP